MPRIHPQPPPVILYNARWSPFVARVAIEMDCIVWGGRWKKKSDGKFGGMGLPYHYKAVVKEIWPEIKQNRWFDLFVENWLKHKFVGVIGPKSSGKTFNAAIMHLVDYYCFPSCTTTLICSTTKERLEDRIWGEIKRWHRIAQNRFEWLPGNLIEGRVRLVTDDRTMAAEGRDFRNGIIGVACKKGNQYVGISDFIGIKNKRVRLCGDELQALPKAFIDSVANLSGNRDLKVTGMGNPAETTDSLGTLCEPAANLGGWDGGIDQQPKTKTWPTRFPNGICIQFPGSDTPNNDGPPDKPLYPYLITAQQMAEDALIWGKNDWHYTMFNEGRMPRGQGSNRVLTRQLCNKSGAFDEPVWSGGVRTQIASLDAAYRSVGGDRCVFAVHEFGTEVGTVDENPESAIASRALGLAKERQILALVTMVTIPISGDGDESPEDQIVKFVRAACEERGIPPERFFFDAGMRTSLVTSFARKWSPYVVSIDFGGKATDRKVSKDIDIKCVDYYKKFVTELWFTVRMVIEAKQYRGLTKEACDEGCAREWKMNGNLIEVETKAEMKEKFGRSPDLFDTIVTGVEGARRLGFEVQRLASAESQEEESNWKSELRKRASKFWKSGTLQAA